MSLASLLSENGHLVLTSSNRIKCSLTNHEMPPRYDVVKAYLESSKFKGALRWSTFNLEEVSPYIIPHRDHDHLLYCQLTGASLNKVPEQIMKHVRGKKFLRKKEEHEEEMAKTIDVLEIPGEELSPDSNESGDEDEEELEQSDSDGEFSQPTKKSRVEDEPKPRSKRLKKIE